MIQAVTQDSTTNTGVQARYNNREARARSCHTTALSGWKQPLQANNPVGIPQMAPPEHTSDKQAYYSFIDSERIKG